MRRFLRSSLMAIGLIGLGLLSIPIWGSSCGDQTSPKTGRSVSTVDVGTTATGPVTGVTVGLRVGQTLQLWAAARDANGNPVTDVAPTWTSSKATVATVSTTGLVTAVDTGTTTITATVSGVSASLTLAVLRTPVASVTVSPANANIAVGQAVQLTATTKDAAGVVLIGRAVAWVSSAANIASVNSSGLVTGVAGGSTTITATSEGKTGTSAITVTTGVPSTVLFSDDFTNGPSGQWTGLLGAWSVVSDGGNNVWKQGATAGDNWAEVGSSTWKDYSVETRIKPLSFGSSGGIVRVFARWQNTTNWYYSNLTSDGFVQLRKYVNGTITDLAPQKSVGVSLGTWYTLKLQVQGSVLTVFVNGVQQLTATDASFTSGLAAIGGWNSTAEFDNVVVTDLSGTTPPPPPPVASVTVAPSTAAIAVGATQQFTATPKDASGYPISGQTITWASSNTTVATVSTSGLATGKAAGTATVSATASGKTGTAALTVTTTTPPPPPPTSAGHVVIVLEENTNYSSSIGHMPWLDGQITTGGSSTAYYATTHPSIGNYFMLTTGQNVTNNDSYSTDVSVDNVIRHLNSAGKTWKGYAEDLPSAGFLGYGSYGNYATKHFPLVYFTDVRSDPNVAQKIVPFTQFATDLKNGTLPNYSFIAPNLCNDAHDCSLSTADNWLKNNIAPLLTQSQFIKDGLLIVTFDESGGDNTNGGGKIEWVAMGPLAKRGYTSSTTYLHPSTLRTMLQVLGVTSYPGAAANAPYMGEFLTSGTPTTTVGSVTVSPTSGAVAVGQTFQLTGTAYDGSGAVISTPLSWSSGSTAIATVDQTGLVTGVAAGTTNITVAAGGKSAQTALTVSASTPPPIAGSCSTWSGTTITLTGLSTSPYQNTSMPPNTRIDATRAQWLLNQPDTWNRMDGGSGACWTGGQILGTISPATPYDDALSGYHLMYGLIADGATARVENVTIFTGGDGIAFDTPGADNWIVRGTHIRYSRDDAIENDFLNNGLIDDVLVEGAYTFISSRTYTGSPDGTNKTVTVQNSLAWLEGMDANYYGTSRPGSGGMWKWVGSGWPNNGNGPSLVINNSTFRADAAPVEGEGSGEYFAPPKLKSCSNNVLVWLGSGSLPRAWPSCFTVMTGSAGLSYWNQKVADWKIRHPAGTDYAPPIIALFRIPSTLSGTVQLTSTAVDDQTLAGVTFKLNGSAIGSEILADPTDHAVLSWDSHGKSNGSYTLTATARDAAGHSTTSAGVSVQVSN